MWRERLISRSRAGTEETFLGNVGRSPVLLPEKLTQCSGLCLMGRRQLQGFSGILSGGPGPEPEGSVSLTEPAMRFTREGGGRACGCLFTANWKDWVFV